ncbi:MAG: hypothetical protein ACRD50_07215 [Candidatus Acidiferrales bacterium]
MAEVLALVDDIFFQAKIAEAARHAGVIVRTVANGEALLAEAQREAPRLILVDLNARPSPRSPVEAIADLRAAGLTAPLIAFLSHVQVELAERARNAGSTQVLPRSQFSQNLATILAQAKS